MSEPRAPRSFVVGVVVLATLLIVVVMGAAAANTRGARELAASDEALARGDRLGAILAARAAAESYVPFGQVSARGVAQLEKIARDADGNREPSPDATRDPSGDAAIAAAARRALRAVALETRANVPGASALPDPTVPSWAFAAVALAGLAFLAAAARAAGFVALRR